METPEHGFVYVATGKRHFKEARESATSLRACHPEAHITIFTDYGSSGTDTEFDAFEPVVSSKGNFGDKIEPLARSPYQKTLFLDTDTYVAGSLASVFQILDSFDIAVVHDPWRADFALETIPDAFPTMNTGLIAYRNTDRVQEFLRQWQDTYHNRFVSRQKDGNDQPAFRDALYRSALRVCILPSEYNLRTWHPCFVGGFGKVKVIHDRNAASMQIARLLNSSQRPRIFGWMPPKVFAFYCYQKLAGVLRRKFRAWGLIRNER